MSSNAWNDFQHEHAGEGLSSTEMSEMYHDEQDTGAELTSTDDTIGDATIGDGGLVSEANSGLDTQSDSTNSGEAGSTNSGNPWNDFQHEHAGEGLSSTEMSEMYHAEQDADDIVGDNGLVSEPNSGLDTQPESTNSEEAGSTNSGNPWNDFQHEHAAEGLSSTEMSEMYHAEQNSNDSKPDANKVAENDNTSANEADSNTNSNPNSDPQEPSTYQPSNPWTEFEHQHRDERKTSSELSKMYHLKEQQPRTEEAVNNVEEDASQSIPNEWNRLQHEHKNENLTPQQMSAMYQQQQQPNSSEANAQQDLSHPGQNAWNEFQHAHKDENLTPQQMSAMYQQENQLYLQRQTENNLRQVGLQSTANELKESKVRQKNSQSSSNGAHGSYNQQKQSAKSSVQWNLFQHLYRGKGLKKEELSSKYNDFKENERTFHWNTNYQLELTSDGRLQHPDTPAGSEALKTGLFDEQHRLRRKGDLPSSIFQTKMRDMGYTDRAQISSMYCNKTGTAALHTADLRQNVYRQHAAVETTRRDADHILELQNVVPELQRQRLDEENFHFIRALLNSEGNIASRGVRMNRFLKRAANVGIAKNHVKLTKFTFEQERVQAEQASLLADKCHQRGCFAAEAALRHVADKCSRLNSIHQQMMQLNENIIDLNDKSERERSLIENIRSYEREHGHLNFHGSQLTEYRKGILDQAHQ